MKKQIMRLSPHQNGKVFGILFAITSLLFVVPMFLIMFFSVPSTDPQGNPVIFPRFMPLLFPILYLIMGYLSTLVGSAVYNLLYKYIGGFEFEVKDQDA